MVNAKSVGKGKLNSSFFLQNHVLPAFFIAPLIPVDCKVPENRVDKIIFVVAFINC